MGEWEGMVGRFLALLIGEGGRTCTRSVLHGERNFTFTSFSPSSRTVINSMTRESSRVRFMRQIASCHFDKIIQSFTKGNMVHS